jgi:hypothetical protein
MNKTSAKVCQEPGAVEDCECLACVEQFHREGESQALRERDLLWKALEVYAKRENYDEYGVLRLPHMGHTGCKVPDCGRIARAALGIN